MLLGLLAVAVAAAFARIASAQDERVLISVNGAFQPTKNDFRQKLTFTINVEEGTSTTEYKVPAAPLADAGVLVRVAPHVAVGVAGSGGRMKGSGAVTARIPHPFFFDKHREISGSEGGLDRTETAVHLQGAYLWPVGDHFLVVVSGGPSLFVVDQELTTTIRFSEQFPFDTATFTGVDVKKVREQRVGFNAGVDATYRLARHIGVGAIVRFSRATVELDKGQESRISVDAGGLQAGGGLRILF